LRFAELRKDRSASRLMRDAANKSEALFHRLARFEEALRHFDLCDELQPNYAPTLQMRALSLRGLKRFEESLADNRRAHALWRHKHRWGRVEFVPSSHADRQQPLVSDSTAVPADRIPRLRNGSRPGAKRAACADFRQIAGEASVRGRTMPRRTSPRT
jgi:tetratricopeptide (TPR) repeat protein